MYGRRDARDRPGIVDEDVDSLDVTIHSGNQRPDRRPIAEVAAIGAEAATQIFYFPGDLAAVLQRSADADYVRSRGRKSDRRRTADSASTAGDERRAATQVELREHHVRQSTRIFIACRPARSSAKTAGTRSSGSTAVINGSKSIEPLASRSIAALKSTGS